MENKTLYCYKLNPVTFNLDKYEIANYMKIEDKNIRYTVNYKNKNGTYTYAVVWDSDLDTFEHSRLYTFNPNQDEVIKIITDYLVDKRTKAYKEYDKWNTIIHHINKNL